MMKNGTHRATQSTSASTTAVDVSMASFSPNATGLQVQASVRPQAGVRATALLQKHADEQTGILDGPLN
jgi:hypothetical protein